MTFEQASERYKKILDSITIGMKSSELIDRQERLRDLLSQLPLAKELNPIFEAVHEAIRKLSGDITHTVLDDLRSREKPLSEASDLFKRVAKKAEDDAQSLNLTNPRLVGAAVLELTGKLSELRSSLNDKDFEASVSHVEMLITLFDLVRTTIKKS